jgi:hypothetical protein
MRKEKGKTYERAPWRGVSSWSSFHPMRVAREAGAGGGVVPVVRRPVVHRVSSPVIRRRSTRGPPHEQLLVRLGRVVHRRLSSIVVVPGRLSFPRRLSFVVPSVVCRRRCRTALVHPQSTRRAVARQRGGGCSVVRRHRPRRRHSSSFVVVVPVHHCRPCLSSFVIVVVCRCRSSSSFVVVVRPSIPVIPRPPLFFVVCRPSPRSTRSPPHEQLLVRLGVGGGVVVGAGGGRFEVGGEGVVGRWGAVVGLVCVITCRCQ